MQVEYVLFNADYVLINKEDMQLKFVYLPFKAPELPIADVFVFLKKVGDEIKFANESQDIHLLHRYQEFFVLPELFSVTKFKEMVDSISAEAQIVGEKDDTLELGKSELGIDAFENLKPKSNVFAESAIPKVVPFRDTHNPLMLISGNLKRKSTGENLTFSPCDCIIGTDSSADLRIQNAKAISRKHAKINFDFNDFTICDLGSTNGTFLNGKRLEPNKPVILEDGDEVRLANEVFTFEEWF